MGLQARAGGWDDPRPLPHKSMHHLGEGKVGGRPKYSLSARLTDHPSAAQVEELCKLRAAALKDAISALLAPPAAAATAAATVVGVLNLGAAGVLVGGELSDEVAADLGCTLAGLASVESLVLGGTCKMSVFAAQVRTLPSQLWGTWEAQALTKDVE